MEDEVTEKTRVKLTDAPYLYSDLERMILVVTELGKEVEIKYQNKQNAFIDEFLNLVEEFNNLGCAIRKEDNHILELMATYD